MKKAFGPIFGETIEQSKRTSSLVDQGVLKNSMSWGLQLEESKKQPISVWRLLPIYLFFLVSFFVLGAKAFSLQVIQGSNFATQAEGNHVRIVTTHAARGAILDRNGKILAQSKPGFRLAIDPQTFPEDNQEVLGLLSDLTKMSKNEIAELAKKAQENEFVTLKNSIDHSTAIAIEAQNEKLPGVLLEISPLREYLWGPIMAPILGYTSEVSKEDLAKQGTAYIPGDKVGRVGAEAAFETRLRGANGYELIKVDAAGKKEGSLVKTNPISGNDVTLSIDGDLNKFIYDELVKAVKTSKGRSGAAVALNPKTGEVLAMVSFPSYDNNLFAKGLTQKEFDFLFGDPSHPLINRAISTSLPPGSTFKLFVSAAALESGKITKDTRIQDTGFINLGGIIYNNWLWTERRGTDGMVDVERAIARSNDIFFYRVGQMIGEEKIGQYAHLFGFGEKTGIELPGETLGLVPSPEWKLSTRGEPWYPGETLNISIGQGDTLATPIQLAVATSAIANGGNLVRPTILPTNTPDIVRKSFVKRETLKTIQEGMIQNQKGDGNVGWIFGAFPISTAGKTGSAEAGGKQNSHAWYTVYAPVENPRIVFTMVVENGGHGSEVVGPVAKKTLEWFFKNRN